MHRTGKVRAACLVWAVSLVGCDAPYVEIAPPVDAGDDAAYVFPDAKVTLTDGAICEGHDEDEDHVPDSCDPCPGVHGSAIGTEVGAACAPSPASDWKRAFFDPLLDLGSRWSSAGASKFVVIPERPDDFTGGAAAFTLGTAVALETFPGVDRIVVSAGFDVQGGRGADMSGVFARADRSGSTFVGCFASLAGDYGVTFTPPAPCGTTADCLLRSIPQPPLRLPKSPALAKLAVRMIAQTNPDGSGHVTCTFFDASAITDATFSVEGDIDAASWGTETRVGMFARHTETRFHWFDVLVRK
ncbi:MAG: hypothetical protein ACXVEF_33095 [Polyangiales bacterium]